MFADRTLAWVGTALILFGSALSLASSQLTPFDGHDRFTLEAIFLLAISGLSIVLVALRLFKALWLITFLCLLVFLQCVATTLPIGLDIPGREIEGNLVNEFMQNRLLSNLSKLFQHHLGWPVIATGVAILIWVASSVKEKFFQVTPRVDEEGESVLGPHAALIVRELADAPKWPLIWGTILILTGIIVLFAGSDISLIRKLFGALISELGFAFFIAFIIVITIEIRTQSERDKQISQGIISYIYGINLDDEMFLSTEEHIFKTPFFRKNAEITYSFIKRSQGKLLLRYICSFDVENVSRNVKDYLINTSVEKAFGSQEQSLVFPGVTLGLQKILIDGEELTDSDIVDARNIKENADKSPDFSHCMYPVKMRAGESKTIIVVHNLEKWERDNELWRTVMPCSGLSLFITWPEEFRLDMRACAIHPSDTTPNLRNGFDSKTEDSGSLKATLDRPFFPFNGVYLWWDVRSAESDSSSAPLEAPIAEVPEAIGAAGGGVDRSGEGNPVAGGSLGRRLLRRCSAMWNAFTGR